MRSLTIYLVGLTMLIGSMPFARCQTQDPVPRKPNFPTVVLNPTGKNGYEELVMASDLLWLHKEWDDVLGGGESFTGLTLSDKRRLLAQPDIQKALGLMQAALRKPISNPRDKMDDETLVPEFSSLRKLGRILVIKIYVEMADGKVSSAIDTLADGLKMSYSIQTDTFLIAGLFGVAIDTMLTKRTSSHLPQFSVRDCEKMIQIVRDWLLLPDPTISLMQAEKGFSRAILQKYKNVPSKLTSALGIKDDDKNFAAVSRIANLAPAAAGPVFDDAAAKLDGIYDRVIAEIKKPAWQRQDIHESDDASPSGILVGVFMPSLGLASDRFVQDQAQVQLLGVHAAIRRYRWEHDSLPNSLAELKLGELAIDPFNGLTLEYKRLDENRYELSSAGPIDRSPETGGPGKRKKLSLTPN